MSDAERRHATTAGLALLHFVIVWKGYVLVTVWGWFVVSQFGAPALNIPQAVGIALGFGLLAYRHQPSEPNRTLLHVACDGLVIPAFTLGFAWIAKGFL